MSTHQATSVYLDSDRDSTYGGLLSTMSFVNGRETQLYKPKVEPNRINCTDEPMSMIT